MCLDRGLDGTMSNLSVCCVAFCNFGPVYMSIYVIYFFMMHFCHYMYIVY